MSDSQTSSATKLSQILKDASKIDGRTATSEVWKQVLKFDPDRDRTIENKYLVMLQIFQYVKNDLNQLALAGTNIEKFSSAIDTILDGLFAFPLTHPWSQVINKIQIKNIDLLESCGDVLIAREKGIKELSEERIIDICASINDLISEIDSLDIEDKIQKSLKDKLNRILKSLDDYEVFGATIFQKVVDDVFIETLVVDQNADKSKWSKETIDKVKNVVDFTFKLTNIYSSIQKIQPHIQPFVDSIVHSLPSTLGK